MYIWIALDVSRSLRFVRDVCLEKNRELLLNEVAFSLPQHISLKISFSVDNRIADEVISVLSDFFKAQTSFELDTPSPEVFGSILWLKFQNNSRLKSLHEELDILLLNRFGVPRHTLDKSFLFHSTLFMDDSKELQEMYEFLKEIELPTKVCVDGFFIGTSESGKPGEYSVLKQIPFEK